MKTSNKGINLIKSFEGLRLRAYKPVSTEKYYTIGYGHYGADVTANMVITETQAIEYLKKDLEKFEAKVNKYQSTYNFNQNQYDALVSFAYNVGNIDGLTKKGTRTIAQISSAFKLYNKGGGKVLQGLVNRRAKEKELFDSINTETVKLNIESNSIYYPKFTGNSSDLDYILRTVGVPYVYTGNYRKRVPLALKNGIANYTGSYIQNIQLINLAKNGLLKKI